MSLMNFPNATPKNRIGTVKQYIWYGPKADLFLSKIDISNRPCRKSTLFDKFYNEISHYFFLPLDKNIDSRADSKQHRKCDMHVTRKVFNMLKKKYLLSVAIAIGFLCAGLVDAKVMARTNGLPDAHTETVSNTISGQSQAIAVKESGSKKLIISSLACEQSCREQRRACEHNCSKGNRKSECFDGCSQEERVCTDRCHTGSKNF